MRMIVAAGLAAAGAFLVDPAASAATDDDPPALCTDRPTKATAACTVPKGMLQIESDLVNWTRNSDAGERSDTWFVTSPLVKYGVGDATDVEVGITPYVIVRTRDSSGVSKARGIGDLTLRVKQRLTPSDAKALFALEPFVKIPTAKSPIGNGKVEGGLIGTGVFSLPHGFSLTISPEVDALADGDGSGRHAQLVGAVNIGKSLTPKLTAYAELWAAQNQDPDGHVRQASADVAVAYLVGPTLQVDAGANVGLNRATPDLQGYVGVSTRF
jgi:Putative MetA-pathway of phenol degradation